MANLGPSEDLMDDFRNYRIEWPEFSRRYRKELREAGDIDKRNHNIKNHGQDPRRSTRWAVAAQRPGFSRALGDRGFSETIKPILARPLIGMTEV
jgi:hypothetical protein